jgi:hypothetical protein
MNHHLFLRNVFVKALLIFVAINLAFTAGDPAAALGKISAYNRLIPGRVRLPYGEEPDRAYNLSLFDIKAMLASHEVSRPKAKDEYRVLLLGDSSVWGYLLGPDQTLSGQLNAQNLATPNGKRVRVYNLGYPTLSLAKDLLILHSALGSQPDLIIWLITLESFPAERQLASPLVQHNPSLTRDLIDTYRLNMDPQDSRFINLSFWDRTLAGRRRALADLLRLQLYGVLWAATGIDQAYPEDYERPQNDFDVDLDFHNRQPERLEAGSLAFDAFHAGLAMAGDVPMLIVNEPVFIASGMNSHIRYNFFYPRWAYDDYRRLLAIESMEKGLSILDAWNSIPPGEFSNSAIHLTPQGSVSLAKLIGGAIIQQARGHE